MQISSHYDTNDVIYYRKITFQPCKNAFTLKSILSFVLKCSEAKIYITKRNPSLITIILH